MRINRWLYRTPPIHILIRFKNDVLVGYKLYRNIVKKYERDKIDHIFYMDYAGSGDTYLSCSYMQSHGIDLTRSIFIAPSNLSVKIAECFNFFSIEMIGKREALCLRIMQNFYGKKVCIIPLLYESEVLIHSGIMRHMQGYQGLDFMTLLKVGYEKYISLPYKEEMWTPERLIGKEDEINSIFKEKQLVKGKTVVLAPYAGNDEVFGIDFSVYEKLARMLIKKGYTVCINSSVSGVIDNLPNIFLPHSQMISFCEAAGYFIGTRSGLCDILATAKLQRKVIIYPNEKCAEGIGMWIDFFSLKNMKLCMDVIEESLPYSNGNEEFIEQMNHIF